MRVETPSATGIFITLEGGEGAGKSTQSRRLKEALEAQGRTVLLTREPGGTPEGEKIRDLITQREGGNWTPLAECLLFFAARQMHVEKIIQPAIARGEIVICDRFTDSTRSYQGYGHGFPLETIEQINALTLAGFEPDLTFVLDLPVEIGLKRSFAQKEQAAGREMTEDRFERLDKSFHEKLRQGFLSIAAQNPQRCRVIDAQQTPDQIFSALMAEIGKVMAVDAV
jgi:dTMP kinase